MKRILSKIKGVFGSSEDYENIEKEAAEHEGEYLEIDSDSVKESKKKIIVKTYYLEEFEKVKPILDDLRNGDTIALINIQPLKDKDIIELKRAINKIKKTTDAIEGEIAGFGDDYIIVTPSFAKIERSKQTSEVKEEDKRQ
jgi:SepF-like predicted cell division protein (DUF552 family)